MTNYETANKALMNMAGTTRGGLPRNVAEAVFNTWITTAGLSPADVAAIRAVLLSPIAFADYDGNKITFGFTANVMRDKPNAPPETLALLAAKPPTFEAARDFAVHFEDGGRYDLDTDAGRARLAADTKRLARERGITFDEAFKIIAVD